MSRQFQLIPYVLPSQSYAASSRTTQTLRDLPKQYLGRLCHLWKFDLGFTLTPTYTAVPTVPGHNNFFTAIDFWDGSFMRFQGGGNHLRYQEQMSAGKNRNPDVETDLGSTNVRQWRRSLHAGPAQYEGAPSDFLIPCGLLENGELRFAHCALTGFSADTTAATGSCQVVAWLALLDELRLPPAYQRINQAAGAADIQLSGRALYEHIALLNSGSFDAITGGDFNAFRLDLGQGDIVPSVNAEMITSSMLESFGVGEFGGIQGDIEAAGDTLTKRVNPGTPTALADQNVDLQPVLFSPPGSRISKMHLAESSARLRWDGTQATAVVLIGRILPQPPTVVTASIGKALGRLNLRGEAPRIKTLSKDNYEGPYKEFMPWKVKIAKTT